MDQIQGIRNSKRTYVAPACLQKGDIATLTQQTIKVLGANDGILFSNEGTTVSIGEYS